LQVSNDWPTWRRLPAKQGRGDGHSWREGVDVAMADDSGTDAVDDDW
jgi:hypothetical protein